jgi:predicted small secreted protein
MKPNRVLPLLALAMLLLAGCNTIAGVGKDVQKAGEAVHDTAERCKDGC